MAETTETHDSALIKVEVPREGADAHETVAPHVQHYAESPNDFEIPTQSALTAHVAQCPICRDLFNLHTVGGDE